MLPIAGNNLNFIFYDRAVKLQESKLNIFDVESTNFFNAKIKISELFYFLSFGNTSSSVNKSAYSVCLKNALVILT